MFIPGQCGQIMLHRLRGRQCGDRGRVKRAIAGISVQHAIFPAVAEVFQCVGILGVKLLGLSDAADDFTGCAFIAPVVGILAKGDGAQDCDDGV